MLSCRGRAGCRDGDQAIRCSSTCLTGKVVRCRIVNVTEDGTVQVVPDHDVVIG
jgi:hypothetical protein